MQSSIATGVISLRAALTPVLLGVVAGTTQVGYYRVAMAPQSGFSAASAPVRLVLLTEQTRDWEHGRAQTVLRGVKRYSLGAAVVALVSVPIFLLLMPWLVRVVFGEEYLPAVDAARIVLVSAAILLVLGWSKSLPVTIGRPRLRIVTHGLETIVLLPLVVVLGASKGVTGAAVAILVSTLRLRAGLGGRSSSGCATSSARLAGGGRAAGGRAVRVVVVSGIWPPDVGGPASHAPALADALLEAGHEVEVVTTADAAPAALPYRVRWVPRSRPAPFRHLAVVREVRAQRAARTVSTRRR